MYIYTIYCLMSIAYYSFQKEISSSDIKDKTDIKQADL